jgi:hypothetical protein
LKKERERKGVIRPRSPMKDQLHLRERRDKVLEKIACSRGAFARIEAFSYRAGNRLAGSIWIVDAHRGDRKRFAVRADEKLIAFDRLSRNVRMLQLRDRQAARSWQAA